MNGIARRMWIFAAVGYGISVLGVAGLTLHQWFRKPYVSVEMIDGAQTAVYHFAPSRNPAWPFKIYVPRNIEDAVRELDHMLPSELVEEMKTVPAWDMVKYHLNLGMWLRNNWGLWRGSRLKDYFKKMGIFHPDDMSGIILGSYWQHLHSRPLRIKEQVIFYQEYWRIWGPIWEKMLPTINHEANQRQRTQEKDISTSEVLVEAIEAPGSVGVSPGGQMGQHMVIPEAEGSLR